MVEHIVLFRWKPEATDAEISQAVTALRALKELVPSIVDLTCGENFGKRAAGYQHGLVVRFEDSAGLDLYQDHPAHTAVVKANIAPISDHVIVVDYDF